MKITPELIESAKTANGGWRQSQLALLGVAWPPPKGWKARVIGEEISEADAVEFVRLNNMEERPR